MADDQGTESIRQMLQGYNAMQMQLGLMPGAGMQPPMGVPLGAPLPPPQVMSPGQAALQAFQIQSDFSNQTFQAAQMTRYIPPPSAPVFAPPPSFGGGGFGGFGGFGGGGGGFHGPTMSPYAGPASPPQMFRGYLPQLSAPFQPMMPSPHFMTPTMQSYGRMQARQADYLGTMSGVMGFGLETMGTMAGAALGSAFGPLGTAAGGFIGGAVMSALNPMANVEADMMRGRQIQNMTAPFMVSGPSLNPYTGTGMDRASAERTARMLRTMVRDPQFKETMGFNTQDIMNLTQAASEQGMLVGAQNPEQLAGMVKNISKSVKALMQITGDPDFRNVMAQLGQMRQMGFEGLASQTGALANRATFARMAGVSQGQMAQMESVGAMQAMQMGLSGATGIRATQFGAGMTNVAVGSGAVGGLELARAGGQPLLSQAVSQMMMQSTQFDPMLMAALEVGPKGAMGVNLERFRANMSRPLSELMQEGAARMRGLTGAQLAQFEQRRGEFGERVLQNMSPTEQMLLPLRQAQGIMAEFAGQGEDIDLGGAFRVMGQRAGLSKQQIQAMTSMYSDERTYRGLEQQIRVQQREARGRAIAQQEMYRTPGVMTRMGRATGRFFGDIEESIADPFARMARGVSEYVEESELAGTGEHIARLSGSATITTARDREMAALGARSDIRRQLGAGGLASETLGGAVRAAYTAFKAGGLGEVFQSSSAARREERRQSANEVADIFTRSLAMNASSAADTAENARRKAQTVQGLGGFDAGRAALDIASAIKNSPGTGGLFGAKSLSSAEVREFTKRALRNQSGGEISDSELERATSALSGDLTALASKYLMQSGQTEAVDRLRTAAQESRETGAGYRLEGKEAYAKYYGGAFESLGLIGGARGMALGAMSALPGGRAQDQAHLTEAEAEQLKKAISTEGAKTVALAAALGDEDMVAQLTGGMSEKQRQTALERAGAVRENLKGALGGTQLLDIMRRSGGSGSTIEATLTDIEKTLGAEKAEGAFRKTAETLASQVGVQSLGVARDESSLLSQMAELAKEGKLKTGDIKDAKMRRAVESFIGAKTDKGREEAVSALSAAGRDVGTSEAEIRGGLADSAEMKAYEKDVAELREASKGMFVSGSEKVQAESAILLGKAAKDLLEVSHVLKLKLDAAGK